jgi:uncharacterized protein YegL
MSQTSLSLISGAHEDGDISTGSMSALANITDIGNIIQQGLGMQVSDLEASEVVLINVLLDNSGSMTGEDAAVRLGFNELCAALTATKQQDNIVLLASTLNDGVIIPYTPLHTVPIMDTNNFRIHGGTPLYKETMNTLATVIAKTKDFENNGIQVRTITLIMTDGGDTDGGVDVTDISTVITDMVGSERHIICGMGFGNPGEFRRVFGQMGISSQWILTAQSTPDEIRKAFQVFSRSAASASKSAAHFAQANAGGFGTP